MQEKMLHKDINSMIGSSMPLGMMRIGIIIHNIEMNPKQGAKLVRAAGTNAKILKEPASLDKASIRGLTVDQRHMSCYDW
ncbi:unnamed protein product [Eruca vesicaria subsp. sativa]|uniref:Large ribosomal subunit protein uL2 C-terminal domain-containing protein n=1 Tax=Eruca vesicaria subsp. sativa TaxID=29727 RepID=A0ABC8LNG9_ERUVS|nr:unnamed protein product [Eruca vesicaria subsp. sativa]